MNILKAAKFTTGQELIQAVQDEHYIKLMEMFNQEVANVTEELDQAYEAALDAGLLGEAQAIQEASEAWAWKSQVFDINAFTRPQSPQEQEQEDDE
jgi:replication initiation and membrane attachment protein DnaB